MSEKTCVILTDSNADLTSEFYEQNEVQVLSMPYTLGGENYDGDSGNHISIAEFYKRFRAGEDASTSQPSVPLLRREVETAIARGLPVVYFCFSSGLSGTYDQAYMVVEEARKKHPDAEIYILDTKLGAVAHGFLVIKAVEMRDRGATAAEIYDWSQNAIYNINGCFTLDELEHLRKGGRIPDVAAIAGAKLDIKPILKFTPEGKLGFDKVARGRKKSLKALADRYRDRRIEPLEGERELVVIASADAQEDAEKLAELVRRENPDADIQYHEVGPVIGSHVGPGMVAIVFWGLDRRSKDGKVEDVARREAARIEKVTEKAERRLEKAERKAEEAAEKEAAKIEREFEKAAEKIEEDAQEA